MNTYYVYILANPYHTVLYVGVTNDLERRVGEHKAGVHEGFTKKYNVTKLVYFEVSPTILAAIEREKQLKSGSRAKKLALIQELRFDGGILNAADYVRASFGCDCFAVLAMTNDYWVQGGLDQHRTDFVSK